MPSSYFREPLALWLHINVEGESTTILNYGYISMISQSGLQSSNIHMQSHTIQL